MSLKEKYQEYKRQREAKAYFRSNNKYILHLNDLPKLIITGLLLSLSIAVVLLILELNINLIYFDLFVGYIIALGFKRVYQESFKGLDIASVIFTFLTFFIKNLLYLIYITQSFTFTMIPNAFVIMFTSGIIEILVIFASCYLAYMQSHF